MLLSGSAFAETASTAEEAKKRLESRRIELESVKSKAKALETDVDAITAEREKLNKRLVETADLVKKSEGQLTSIEGRLGELGAQEKISGARSTSARTRSRSSCRRCSAWAATRLPC